MGVFRYHGEEYTFPENNLKNSIVNFFEIIERGHYPDLCYFKNTGRFGVDEFIDENAYYMESDNVIGMPVSYDFFLHYCGVYNSSKASKHDDNFYLSYIQDEIDYLESYVQNMNEIV